MSKWNGAAACSSSRKRTAVGAFRRAYVFAYVQREYTSIRVNVYMRFFLSSIVWMVSICTKAPGYRARGRSMGGWYRLYGLLFFKRPERSSVRLTEESETITPSSFKMRWMTSDERFDLSLV